MATGIETERFGKLGAVFARGARQLVGAPDTIDDIGDFDERVIRVGKGLAQVAGKLGAKMADEARGQT